MNIRDNFVENMQKGPSHIGSALFLKKSVA